MITKMNKKIFLIFIYTYLLFYRIKNDDYRSIAILSSVFVIISYLFLYKNGNIYEGIDNSVQFTEEEEEARREEQEAAEDADTTAATADTTAATTDIPAAANTPFVSAEYARLREEARKKDGPDGPTLITENDSPSGEGADEKEPISDESMFVEKEEVKMTPTNNKFRMGPYDGLCISSDKLMENEIIENDRLVTYFGSQVPPQYVTSQDILKGPTVDGTKDAPQKLTMFANNKTSLNCCKESPYMTSTGCVCLTDNQRSFIRTRGFNKSEGGI